jgi:hypothetical protein
MIIRGRSGRVGQALQFGACGLVLRIECQDAAQALALLLVRVYHLAHPQPGLGVLRVGVQNPGEQAFAGFVVAGLNGLDGALQIFVDV